MQTHYKQLSDSQSQIMKTNRPIQSEGLSKGVPWTFGKKKKTSTF